LIVFFALSFVDFRFMRKTGPVVFFYLASFIFLLVLFVLGSKVNGARSRFTLGSFSLQPVEFAKFALIFVLAKYFSKRHVEIANFKHVIISGIYALLIFAVVLIQPDFGSAIVIFCIWFGMVLFSGISKKHLLTVIIGGAAVFLLLWNFGLHEYQKQRVLNFIHPLADVRGGGYNAYQSMIAVGSGGFLGKGIGFGTQSRLNFLPEYQTDFIFAAFSEEWGYIGVLFICVSFALVIFRVLSNASRSESNFESLYGVGVAIFLMSHFFINVGMNIGLMPVTGIPLPFVSYGGSNMLVCFASLGVLMGMRRYSRAANKEALRNEFLGV
jgi:rod shape determining protein RodA